MSRVALAQCRVMGCRVTSVGGAPPRVSTVNPRFGWIGVSAGDEYLGMVVRRSTRVAGDWHVIAREGSGAEPCSYWSRHVPSSVLWDLRITGFNGQDPTRCGQPPTAKTRPASPPPRTLRACPFYFNTSISSTRDVSCGAARRLVDAAASRRCGNDRRCRVDGYSCRTVSPNPGDVPGSFQTTCVRGRRKVVFSSAP
jgi:hypothetical protein